MAEQPLFNNVRVHPGLTGFLMALNEALAADAQRGLSATTRQLRKALSSMTAKFGPSSEELARVEDADFPVPHRMVPVRCYSAAPDRAAPVCVYLHGGGHLAGSVDVYDNICRQLARVSGALVVSVEYRLAPEAPYSAGLEDARAVLAGVLPWLRDEGWLVNGKLFLAGDSAGGALSATLACETSLDDSLPRLDGVLLIYPSLDYTLSQPSVERNGRGYLLERGRIEWYFDRYLPEGEDRRAASPLFMPFEAARFPPVWMVTAGLCPLVDEAKLWHTRLRMAGVTVEELHFPNQIHAYLNLHKLVPEACEKTYASMADFIRRYGAGEETACCLKEPCHHD